MAAWISSSPRRDRVQRRLCSRSALPFRNHQHIRRESRMPKTVCLLVLCASLFTGLGAQAAPQEGGTELVESSTEASAPVCRETSPPESCSDGFNPFFSSIGPGDNCCGRHLEICGSICEGAISYFSCGDNGRGGCWSRCICRA